MVQIQNTDPRPSMSPMGRLLEMQKEEKRQQEEQMRASRTIESPQRQYSLEAPQKPDQFRSATAPRQSIDRTLETVRSYEGHNQGAIRPQIDRQETNTQMPPKASTSPFATASPATKTNPFATSSPVTKNPAATYSSFSKSLYEGDSNPYAYNMPQRPKTDVIQSSNPGLSNENVLTSKFNFFNESKF